MWRAGKAKGKEEAYYPSETGFKFLMFLNVRCERLNPQIHTLSPLSLGQFCVMDSGPQLQFVSLKPPTYVDPRIIPYWRAVHRISR